MNYKNLVLSLGLVAAASGVSSAQTPPIVASESRVTLNFTLDYQIPSLAPKDSSGKKTLGIKRTANGWAIDKSTPDRQIFDNYTYNELGQTKLKTRYGNKEFIEDLRAQGVIQSVAGWYISSFSNAQGQIYAIYLRNTTTSTTPIRLDTAYLTLSSVAVPVLNQATNPPAADPASVVGVVDTYSYNGYFRRYSTPAQTEDFYLSKGTRNMTSRHTLTINLATRFPTSPTGLVRLETQTSANPTAAYPPTWIVKSYKSTGLIMAGTRVVLNEVGQSITVPILIDGTFNGAVGVAYDASGATATPALPTGIVAAP